MKRLFILIAPLALLIASCHTDNTHAVVPQDGQVRLTFINGSDPIADAEVKINHSAFPSFDQPSIFEGTTDANGVIEVPALTAGQFQFRVPTTSGFFYGNFQVIAGQEMENTYDVVDYASTVSFNVEGAPDFKTGDYYLFPTGTSYQDFSNEDIIANSIHGSLENGVLTFSQVLPDHYWLLAPLGTSMVAIESGVLVSDRFNSSRPTSIGGELILTGESWTVSETVSIGNAEVVDNEITGIRFSGYTMTLTFSDGTSVDNEIYVLPSTYTNELNVLFDENGANQDIHQPTVDDIFGIWVSLEDYSITIRYDDDAFFTYEASFAID